MDFHATSPPSTRLAPYRYQDSLSRSRCLCRDRQLHAHGIENTHDRVKFCPGFTVEGAVEVLSRQAGVLRDLAHAFCARSGADRLGDEGGIRGFESGSEILGNRLACASVGAFAPTRMRITIAITLMSTFR